MFLPLGDAPNPGSRPWVTYALIALNVAVFVLVTLPLSVERPSASDPAVAAYLRAIADQLPPRVSLEEVYRQLTRYDLFVFANGYRPADPSLVTLGQSMFLHSGFAHLFGNMLFLWIYGDNVEHRLGGVPYLAWYLTTGAAATLFHSAFNSASNVPLIGASGAISGVLGFYFLWFPHNVVRVWVFLFPFVMNVIQVPARIVLGFYLLLDNLLPFLLTSGAGGGVAYGAHIGGFVAGLGIAWVTDLGATRSRPTGFSGERRSDRADGVTVRDLVRQALGDRRYEDAARRYFAYPAETTRRWLSPAESLDLARWLDANGHEAAALTLYQRQLRDFPAGPGAAEAHLGAGLLQLQRFRQPTAAYQHFVDALDLGGDPTTVAAARDILDRMSVTYRMRAGR
jgi:membrane associated rhomboid family serine protease